MEGERCAATGKVCYSERGAREKIAWFRRHNGRTAHFKKNIPLRVYQCPFCGTWHLTHYRNKRGKK